MKRWTTTMALAVILGSLTLGSLPALAGVYTPRADWREWNQQRRIYQGWRAGQLSPREFRRLERQQGRIRLAEARMRADGNITPRERARLNRMLNHGNGDIYRLRHNRWRR